MSQSPDYEPLTDVEWSDLPWRILLGDHVPPIASWMQMRSAFDRLISTRSRTGKRDRALIAYGRKQGRNQGAADALWEAANEVRRVRENGLDDGMESHPTAEHFEQWLRDLAGRYTRDVPCGERPPLDVTPNGVPCHLIGDHDEHISTTGCAGSVIRWPRNRDEAQS